MFKHLARLTRAGLQYSGNPHEERRLLLTNRISLLLFALNLLLFICYVLLYEWTFITSSIMISCLAVIATLEFNRRGWIHAGRIWLSLLLPVSCLVVSIVSKQRVDIVQEPEFYDYRIIMLTSAVLPCIIFNLKEPGMLGMSLLVHLFALILYDPLHNAFGVGYYDLGQTNTSYYFTNLVFFLSYLLFVGAFLFLKKDGDFWEEQHQEFIRNVNAINRKLEERNAEIESQNEMIVAQSHVLNLNQQQLTEANQLIQRQKELLRRENLNLEGELVEKNKELTQTNAELIKYNTELRQFSFTVSHNLRSPVASLLGLVDLVNESKLDDDNKEIVHHIKESTRHLDGIITDLNKIVDIRHDIFKVRQRVEILDEIMEIKHIFQEKLVQHGISIHTELAVPGFFSVKPMIHSILYNLISNSIKYRSNQRPLNITITSTENIDFYILQVTDNGMGIDLAQHRENLFRLYKRFHLHIDGKGLGLYLVRLQCESLGGFIEVESEVSKFTRFIVYLRKPTNVRRQILYNESHALIFYDAMINSIGVIWRLPADSGQFKTVFLKCLEFLHAYHSPNWISDMTSLGTIAIDDQNWMLEEIMPSAKKGGLKRMAWVKASHTERESNSSLEAIDAEFQSIGVQFGSFANVDNATEWIQEHTENNIPNLPVNGIPG